MLRLDANETVDKLIHEYDPCWKTQLLHDLFSTAETNLILSIPLSFVDRKDQQIWHCTKNGLFTVKIAYHLHKSILATNVGETS